MNYFNVIFPKEDIEVLKENNIIIKNNERFYIFDEHDFIPKYGVPVYYKIEDFFFNGTSWKDLIFGFGNWLIKKIDITKYININNRFGKNIFSKTKEINFIGPLENGLYINNNLGVKLWQQICDLLDLIGIENKGNIFIHYPFHRESEEIGKLLWKKEVKLFYRYLLGLGYNKDDAMNHIENLKKLCSIFKDGTKKHIYLDLFEYVTNPFILTVDSRQDLANLISKIKKFKLYKDEYYSTLENIVDFKNELYYKNMNYSVYNVDSFLND